MDLDKKVRTESKNNRSYSPCITKHKCPFWNMVAIVLVVASGHVRKAFEMVRREVIVIIKIPYQEGVPCANASTP